VWCYPEDAVKGCDDTDMEAAGALSTGNGHGSVTQKGKHQTGAVSYFKPRHTAVVGDIAEVVD
jgi:hypothetical protein